jgi:WD40 repeat protein
VKKYEGHTHSIICFLELFDGNLASGSLDKTIIIWDKDTAEIINTLEGFD